MTQHKIHDELPAGFHWADALQTAEYIASGSVNGAAKVIFVKGEAEGEVNLAVRLRPPRRPGYDAEYLTGWEAGKQAKASDVLDSKAYADGYRDRAEGRGKWHLAYCTNHGDHEGGCGA